MLASCYWSLEQKVLFGIQHETLIISYDQKTIDINNKSNNTKNISWFPPGDGVL